MASLAHRRGVFSVRAGSAENGSPLVQLRQDLIETRLPEKVGAIVFLLGMRAAFGTTLEELSRRVGQPGEQVER